MEGRRFRNLLTPLCSKKFQLARKFMNKIDLGIALGFLNIVYHPSQVDKIAGMISWAILFTHISISITS